MQRTRAPRSNSQINNAVKGFVEIFSFNAMDFVKQDYISNNRMLYRISANSGVLKQTPAKVYEVVAAISISGAIVVSILIGKTDESFLNLLIVLTLATYRIMPTVSRVNSQLLNLRNSWYILMSLKYSRDGLLTRDSAARPKQASLKKAEEVSIQLDNLTFKYADGDLVLNSLSHRFEPGMIHAIVGPSGSGKSTLLNAMLGMLELNDGTINFRLDNQERTLEKDISHKEWLHQIAYLSQQPYFFSGSVRENMTFNAQDGAFNIEEFENLVDRIGLRDCLGSRPLDFELNEGATSVEVSNRDSPSYGLFVEISQCS